MNIDFKILEKTKDDFGSVMLFLNTIAHEKFGCDAPPPTDFFVVAKDKDNIVGCIGSSFASLGMLHIEGLYNWNINEDRRTDYCEIGRWIAKEKDISLLLLKELIEFLIQKGIKFALCELRSGPARLAQQLGLPLKLTSGKLNIDLVPKEGRLYYEGEEPKLYKFDIRNIEWKY